MSVLKRNIIQYVVLSIFFRKHIIQYTLYFEFKIIFLKSMLAMFIYIYIYIMLKEIVLTPNATFANDLVDIANDCPLCMSPPMTQGQNQ